MDIPSAPVDSGGASGDILGELAKYWVRGTVRTGSGSSRRYCKGKAKG